MGGEPDIHVLSEKEQKLINDERKKNRTKWKYIVNRVSENTKRLEVPGGWIYKISSCDGRLTSVFVPNEEIDNIDVLEDYDA